MATTLDSANVEPYFLIWGYGVANRPEWTHTYISISRVNQQTLSLRFGVTLILESLSLHLGKLGRMVLELGDWSPSSMNMDGDEGLKNLFRVSKQSARVTMAVIYDLERSTSLHHCSIVPSQCVKAMHFASRLHAF